MIVDASAIVAVVAREHGWQRIVASLESSHESSVSTMTLFELRIVLSSDRFRAGDLVDQFIERFSLEPVDFTLEHSVVAAEAYSRYGRSNHPARLNFGDCAAYATAKIADETLLFVGDDFAQTDVMPALR